ncbi:hypothetical protein E1258_25325 [Micromonospora sp. KC207]|uniref:DUF6182 family protein n=1 Tax=Micromonospora sp. KC207 TaxID=2530377 RepID=UPI00104636C7|nr:DUF6182 family protein [Micromonospora sp. KC207]TDC52095.1 hypothetical protein E1258_25325 [Micromonospora sp. KC207]
MMLGQRGLHRHAAGRLAACAPELAARHDLDTMAGLLAARHEIGADPALAATAVAVVLRRFALADLVRECCAFALGLDEAAMTAWRRSFTRAVFLVGNPANLRDRFAFAHVAPDSSAAWTRPATDDATAALRRLLKALDAPAALRAAPRSPVPVGGPLPAAGAARPGARLDLHVATAGVTVVTALVEVHHLLAEAVADGLVEAGDSIVPHTVPRLVGLDEPPAALRVGIDPLAPDRWYAAAALTVRRGS